MFTIKHGIRYMMVGGGDKENDIIAQMGQMGWQFKKAIFDMIETEVPTDWKVENGWGPNMPDENKVVQFKGPNNERITYRVRPPEGVKQFEFTGPELAPV